MTACVHDRCVPGGPADDDDIRRRDEADVGPVASDVHSHVPSQLDRVRRGWSITRRPRLHAARPGARQKRPVT